MDDAMTWWEKQNGLVQTSLILAVVLAGVSSAICIIVTIARIVQKRRKWHAVATDDPASDTEGRKAALERDAPLAVLGQANPPQVSRRPSIFQPWQSARSAGSEVQPHNRYMPFVSLPPIITDSTALKKLQKRQQGQATRGWFTSMFGRKPEPSLPLPAVAETKPALGGRAGQREPRCPQ